MFQNLFILILVISACATKKQMTSSINPLPYQLNEPTQTMVMPVALKEISGLGFSGDGSQLVAIQDEQGIIFYLNKKTGNIERQVTFKDPGDYEDLQTVRDTTYVLKSKGVLYATSAIQNPTPTVDRYDLGLGKDADLEGLGYDKAHNQLFIACKGVTENAFERSVYGFSLTTKKRSEKPLFTISLSQIQDFVSTNLKGQSGFDKYFDATATEFHFGPSAIAVHPLTGELYMLSSVGKLLLVLSPEGKILNIEKLDKKIHVQPEGILFEADGTLYISNEGKKEQDGIIYRFDYKK